MKRPSFQFYPGDWLRDTALRSCSVGARGLWADMLCLMHEGTPYGYLKVGSKVILKDNLARIVGATLPEVEGWLEELCEACVYSEDSDGIYSRRMIRDEQTRVNRAAGGAKGGNPALLRLSSEVILTPNLKPTPSSSSASSSAKRTPIVPKGTEEGFDVFWQAYPRRIAKQDALKAYKKHRCSDQLDVILPALEVAKATADWTKDNGQFVPYPATWINARRWDDEHQPIINGRQTPCGYIP